MTFTSSSIFKATAKPTLLNDYEIHLFNLLEEYFHTNQIASNRCIVVPQVSLTQFVKIDRTFVEGVQVNAMSVDCLVTSPTSKPLLVFEADGYYHGNIKFPTSWTDKQIEEAEEKIKRQLHRDKVKDKVLKACGVPIIRVAPLNVHTSPTVLAYNHEFGSGSGIELPFSGAGGYPEYLIPDDTIVPPYERLMELGDVESELLKLMPNWVFPAGWKHQPFLLD